MRLYPPISDEIRERENEILNIFVDICALFQRQPEVDELNRWRISPAAEANLFAYLHLLDTRGDGLPPAFVDALRRALAHYGIQISRSDSPRLEESLLWIYKSHARMEQQIAPVLGLLERRLRELKSSRRTTASPFARSSTGWSLSPAACFPPSATWPGRSAIATSISRCLSKHASRFMRKSKSIWLVSPPTAGTGPPRQNQSAGGMSRSHSRACCPDGSRQPRRPTASIDAGGRSPARYYRIRTLRDIRLFAVDGQSYVSAEYEHEGQAIHVFTTHVEYSQLRMPPAQCSHCIEAVPAEHDVVVDFFVWNPGSSVDAGVTQQEIQLDAQPGRFPAPDPAYRGGDRAAPVSFTSIGGRQFFTYRPCDGLMRRRSSTAASIR